MASNVSNLLKEKIVTPVANSVAAQVDNKVKNGIILRKFIGVQLGESNTGCQLVKIDLNKINVKDPSYEFTLYIKAFSQKGLFNFIVNVNKTDSLQVDVKCEVKNSDSSNGEAIGYYDVDAVGNTITISLVKAFVVNTSINECKFVSTKDTLNISDLDIDWSDTGNVKTSTSINIRYNQTSIYEYDEYFYPYKPDFADGEMYQIAKFDFSEILNKTLTGNKDFNISIDIIYHLIGEFHICFDLTWISNMSMISMIRGAYEKIPFQSTMEKRNFDELFKFCRKDNTTLLLLINPPAMYMSEGDFVIRRIEVHRADADIESDLVKIDVTPEKLVNSDGSLVIGSINRHKASIPAPTTSEVDNKYLLGADAKWHPRKAGNEYIANLKPTEEIKGLSETDTTKGISFVTIDFNSLSQKVVEAAPSTMQEFMINMKVLTYDLGIITISTKLSVTTAGLIACSGVLSDLGMGSNTDRFSTIYSAKLGAVTSPGFFVNDTNTKIFKIALYTPIAIDGVKIIDAVVTSYSDIIDESDIVFTWELGILEKKPIKPLRSNIIYTRIALDRELVFDQMDIETPISETDEDTLFAEQIKHNGLVPAPGKYEVNNGYYLKADGTWDLPKNSINDYIALVTPSGEMANQTGTTTGVSFVTIDYSKAYEKLSLATNETTGFRLYLTIFNERYGKLEIGLNTIIVNLGENINQGVIPYADTGTYPSTHLGQVQSNYGEDIRTPIFTDIDPTTHKIRVGIYAVGTNKPVIVKNCTIHQTYDTIDTHDIDIVWEANVVTFSEENTTSALQYINMNWGKAFSPILWMMNPEGSYSDSQVRKWRRDFNGFVPAPAKYEADQGLVLCADGSWIPTRGNNNSVSVVTPSEEMTSQVSSTVGITFATFDYSKIIESLSLAVNTGSGFEGVLIINTKLFGEILINFSVSLFNLNGTINKGATAYANVGTKSTSHISQISLIQNTYGADIKTPVFIYTDSVNNICKIGLYGSASRFPVIIKDCTLNQTYSDFDVNDITITWEPTTISISEETTNDAPLFTNMDWSKIFTPIANMTDPDGSYSENNLRRWKLQNNGLVPAPAKYEADQGRVLYADGTWGPIKGIIRNRTFTVTPHTDSSSTQTNDYAITEGAEDLAIAINENYSVDINIVFSGLGTKNNNNTTLTITGVTGTVNLYDYSGNPIKYITDGMSMKCTIFKNTIDDPVESMNAYCIYDIISYPDTMNGPSE